MKGTGFGCVGLPAAALESRRLVSRLRGCIKSQVVKGFFVFLNARAGAKVISRARRLLLDCGEMGCPTIVVQHESPSIERIAKGIDARWLDTGRAEQFFFGARGRGGLALASAHVALADTKLWTREPAGRHKHFRAGHAVSSPLVARLAKLLHKQVETRIYDRLLEVGMR